MQYWPLHSVAAVSETIIVKFSAKGKKYNLHTDLLKHHSGYFRGALSGAFRETDDGIIPLLDVDIDAFDVFVDWLYRDTLRENLEYIRLNPKSGVATAFRTYILADRLLIPGLKSALIDGHFSEGIVDLEEWYPGCRRIIHGFKNLPENDPLIRLYVDLWSVSNIVYRLDAYDKCLVSDLPQAFLVCLMRRMNEVGQKLLLRSTLKREDYNDVATIHE